jgi:hypothetical protein
MKQLFINSSIVFLLFFALTSHTVNWDAKLVNYAVAANGNPEEFCKKNHGVRSDNGKICKQGSLIAYYILAVCGSALTGSNVADFVNDPSTNEPSQCFAKAVDRLGNYNKKGIIGGANIFINKHFKLSDKKALCRLLTSLGEFDEKTLEEKSLTEVFSACVGYWP